METIKPNQILQNPQSNLFSVKKKMHNYRIVCPICIIDEYGTNIPKSFVRSLLHRSTSRNIPCNLNHNHGLVSSIHCDRTLTRQPQGAKQTSLRKCTSCGAFVIHSCSCQTLFTYRGHRVLRTVLSQRARYFSHVYPKKAGQLTSY